MKKICLSSFVIITPLFAQEMNIGGFSFENFKILFLLAFFLFLTGIIYYVVVNFVSDKVPKTFSLFFSLATAALISFFIVSSPLGKFIIEVVLPFLLFSVFFLMLVYVFFSALGIKFGPNKNEEGFIHVASPIVMWVGLGLLLISFLAALKLMGYKIIDKILQPSILGILVFFIVLGIMIMTLEEEEKK